MCEDYLPMSAEKRERTRELFARIVAELKKPEASDGDEG